MEATVANGGQSSAVKAGDELFLGRGNLRVTSKAAPSFCYLDLILTTQEAENLGALVQVLNSPGEHPSFASVF